MFLHSKITKTGGAFMKKKAVLKTIIDVMKFIACAVFVLGAAVGIVYFVVFAPYWVLNALGLWEKYADTAYGYILTIEFAIALGVYLVFCLISALYHANLEEITQNKVISLENNNPTKAEKGLYHNYGYYPVERHPVSNGNSDADYTYIRYAVCYTEPEQRKSYPSVIEIEEQNIDYENSITFETCAESVKISGLADTDLLEIILERAKELFGQEKLY